MDSLPAIALLTGTIVGTGLFWLRGRRHSDPLERRKHTVGGIVLLVCGLLASGTAALISSIDPPS